MAMFDVIFFIKISAFMVLFYTLYGVIYRLYLSPIAKFPGRKLAALSFWYEFYYDVIKRGEYVWEIEKMHEKNGPIVRINPYELHVNDPAFISQLYPRVAKNVEKWAWSAGMFGSTGMAFSTVGHDLHRLRRGAFGNFFSKKSIRSLEPIIQRTLDRLCRQLEQHQRNGNATNMVHAYSALTHDVITEYCFADCSNWISKPEFAVLDIDFITKPAEATHTIKQFPQILSIIEFLPDWLIRVTCPLAAQLRAQRAHYEVQVGLILRTKDRPLAVSHPTIFHSLRDDPDLPLQEKTRSRLAEEAQSLIGAGTVSSAHVLASTTYHILANSSVLQNLLSELESTIPDPTVPASLLELENLPYLTAIIYEGLRLGYGIMHRLQRVHPNKTLHYGSWTIPRGTPVSMTSLFTHENPDLFPCPQTFDPSRWLQPNGRDLVKYLFNFGKGTRQCIGLNLAYAELYMALATVFRRFGRRMCLFETERERDVDVAKDFFVTSPSLESKGVRVVIGEC